MLEKKQTPHGHILTEPRTGASNFEKRWQGIRDLKLGDCLLRDLVGEALTSFLAGKSSSSPDQASLASAISEHALWPAFEDSMGQVMYHRRVFTTRNGYFGVGSRTLTAGDKICVLLGCAVPVMLRPHGQQFELLGECYVHGIMAGEALNAVKLGKAQLMSLEIR